MAFVAKIETDPVLKRIATKIKMVFPLYNEEVHLLARKDIADFEDLADKTVAIGEEGSGIYLTARLLFEASDVKPREMIPIAPDEALALLKQGKIDAMFYVAGYPVKLFTEDVSRRGRACPGSHHEQKHSGILSKRADSGEHLQLARPSDSDSGRKIGPYFLRFSGGKL